MPWLLREWAIVLELSAVKQLWTGSLIGFRLDM
jgi:hypothetical protein